MTLFWLRPTHPIDRPAAEAAATEPEFDEDGRRYVFRFAPAQPQQYTMNRDRLFAYARTHELPGARARAIRRDLRNSASFYEDVREIQTHPDVIELASEPVPTSLRLRLRSVS